MSEQKYYLVNELALEYPLYGNMTGASVNDVRYALHFSTYEKAFAFKVDNKLESYDVMDKNDVFKFLESLEPDMEDESLEDMWFVYVQGSTPRFIRNSATAVEFESELSVKCAFNTKKLALSVAEKMSIATRHALVAVSYYEALLLVMDSKAIIQKGDEYLMETENSATNDPEWADNLDDAILFDSAEEAEIWAPSGSTILSRRDARHKLDANRVLTNNTTQELIRFIDAGFISSADKIRNPDLQPIIAIIKQGLKAVESQQETKPVASWSTENYSTSSVFRLPKSTIDCVIVKNDLTETVSKPTQVISSLTDIREARIMDTNFPYVVDSERVVASALSSNNSIEYMANFIELVGGPNNFIKFK